MIDRPGPVLAVLALALAAAGLVSAPRAASLSVDDLVGPVARGEDRVDAVELAGWMRDGVEGLRVVDLRSEAAFETFHVPLAERVDVRELPRADLPKDAPVVLYSDEGSEAGQAWTVLRLLGYRNVRVLRGGAGAWVSQVMMPVLPDDATDEERERWPRVSELSRYFGGAPRVGGERDAGRPASEGAIGEAVEAARRRGCAWGR